MRKAAAREAGAGAGLRRLEGRSVVVPAQPPVLGLQARPRVPKARQRAAVLLAARRLVAERLEAPHVAPELLPAAAVGARRPAAR